MSETTTFVDREIFHKQITSSVQELSKKYNKISSILTEDLITLNSTTLHTMGKLLTPNSLPEKALFRLLGGSLLQAESLAGGSAILGLRFSLGLLGSLLRHEDLLRIPDYVLIKQYDDLLLGLREDIQKSYETPTEDDIQKHIKDICEDDLLTKVVFETIKLAGLEGKVYIESGRQNNFVIERKTGYNFKVRPFKFFLDSSSASWERQEVRILLVDGVIEQVSEIDQLLNTALITKQPGVIIARGFSEEVIATLKVNFDKGLLDVLPVRINSDLESINILNDLASVCGCDVISSLKGEMICMAKWENLPIIQRIRCLPGMISIEHSKTKNQVTAQIRHLLSRRLDNSNIEDVTTLIDERIKCLTSEAVIVRLPNITDLENQTIRAKFDTSLRSVKSILNNGTLRLSTLIEHQKLRQNNTPLGRIVLLSLMGLSQHFQEKVSSLSVYLALYICGKQTLIIYSSNGAILPED